MSLQIKIILLVLLGTNLIHAQTQPPKANIPLPSQSYCETTRLDTNQTFLEFRWNFSQFQKYYETARKFYDSIEFQTELSLGDIENGSCNIGISLSPRTFTATMEFSKPERFASNALFEGELKIEGRHGKVSYTSESLKRPNPELKFRWHFDYDDRQSVGRHLDIYTKIADFATSIEGNVLNGQPVRFVFRIARYGIHQIFSSGGRNGGVC